MSSLVEGEPTRIASITSTSDTWQMQIRERVFTVHVSPYNTENQFIVAVEVIHEEIPQLSHRRWTIMSGRLTGGIVTPEFIDQTLHVGEVDSEPVALLVASALGRPYALSYAPPEAEASG